MIPDCHSWAMWVGREVEGITQIGALTLFVRSGPWGQYLRDHPEIKRVWLCKEFLEGHAISALVDACETVRHMGIPIAVEVELRMLDTYLPLRPFVNFYVKVPVEGLVSGDHVCIGPAFSDEAFVIGQGYKVTPSLYMSDKKIL